MRLKPEGEFVSNRKYGKANIVLHEDFPAVEAVQITFLGEDSSKWIAFGKENYPEQVQTCDANVAIEPVDEQKGLAKLVSFTPCSVMLPVRFKEFTHREDEAPAPREITPKNEKYKPYSVFTPILEVIDGYYKGLHL